MSVDPSGLAPCNVWNVTYEGSGNFPCYNYDASIPSPPAGGSTGQVTSSNGQVYKTGSFIGQLSTPELTAALNACSQAVQSVWGWVADSEPLRIMALLNALDDPSCSGLFNLPPNRSVLGELAETSIVRDSIPPISPGGPVASGYHIPAIGASVLNTYPGGFGYHGTVGGGLTVLHEFTHREVDLWGAGVVRSQYSVLPWQSSKDLAAGCDGDTLA